MPIYEYAASDARKSCEHCKNGFEIIQNLKEKSLTTCPECGQAVSKQISAPNVGASQAGFDDKAKSLGFSKLKKVSKGEYEKLY